MVQPLPAEVRECYVSPVTCGAVQTVQVSSAVVCNIRDLSARGCCFVAAVMPFGARMIALDWNSHLR